MKTNDGDGGAGFLAGAGGATNGVAATAASELRNERRRSSSGRPTVKVGELVAAA